MGKHVMNRIRNHILDLWIAILGALVLVGLFLAFEAKSQTVKPAFPETHHLRRRYFDRAMQPVVECDATDDPYDHQNCVLEPGRTVDDLLDTFHRERAPCPDPHMKEGE